MKKLAYFLVLFVGMNVSAQDRVGTGGGGNSTYSSGGGGCSGRGGDAYLQVMHWRTFVVSYSARCLSSRQPVQARDSNGNSVTILETTINPQAKAEVSQYIASLQQFFINDSGGSQADETVRRYKRFDNRSGNGEGGGAYGSHNQVDMCAVRLGQDYHNMIQSQGQSTFCDTNRAKYDMLIADKNPSSIKNKALQTVCSNNVSFNSKSICSPQSASIQINTSSVTAASSGGGNSEEMMAAQSTNTDKPTSNASANLQRTVVHNSSGVQTEGADAEAPPQGAAIQTAPLAATTPAAPAKSAKNEKRAVNANQNKEVANGGGGSGGAIVTAGDGDSGSTSPTTAHVANVKISSTSGKPAAATGKPETANTGKDIKPINIQLTAEKKEEFRKIFVGTPACTRPSTSANEDLKHRIAQMDAMINSYFDGCVGSSDPRMGWLGKYKTYSSGYLNDQFHIKSGNFQKPYNEYEKKLIKGNKTGSYCRGPRKDFIDYYAQPQQLEQHRISDFATKTMCK